MRSTDSGYDTITDFTDGTDVIALELPSGADFNDLEIAQSGNNTNISYDGSVELVLASFASSNLTIIDFSSNSTSSLTLNGTSDGDAFIGGSGADTITTGIGSDQIYARSGDDVITVDGAGNKTINGGTGTDSLAIDLVGHNSLSDFVVSYSSGTTSLTSSTTGDVISFSSIEALSVNSVSYQIYEDNVLDHEVDQIIWSQSEKAAFGYGSSNIGILGLLPNAPGLSTTYTGDLTFYGSDGVDSYNMGVPRASGLGGAHFSGTLQINSGGGNDSIYSAKLKNSDSIDLGSGNDYLALMVGGSGTVDFGSFDLTLLDGGAGTDTLSFEESTTGGNALRLTTGSAENFENLRGTSSSEELHGDAVENELSGLAGDDKLYGYGASDVLKGGDGDDTLYGGDGSDNLQAGAGDDKLDGGTGADTIITGSGSDQIILRAGDGGNELSDADIITDFTDGSDDFGLTNSLSFDDLTRTQGTGDYANDTIIKYGSEYLAILRNIDVSLLTEADFEDVDIA